MTSEPNGPIASLKTLHRVSWAGTAFFFLAIGRAAALYPGGNRFDGKATHYSFFGNFLCDLFDRVAYNGIQNPGRPYAIFGTYALAVALLLFWLALPALFVENARQRKPVRFFGVTAMLFSFFIASRFHDGCIIVAVPFGLTAFILSIIALAKNHEAGLARLGMASVAVCVMNYLSFVFQVFPRTLPGVQKAALISFLAWVFAAMLRLTRVVTHR